MSQLRKDIVTDRWVIVAPERGTRPVEASPEPDDDVGPHGCPFCEGNEFMTPPEVYAVRDHGEPNQRGWYVRVVPHKFPVLMVEGNTDVRQSGVWSSMDGIGAHEVVIETPQHDEDMAFMAQEQVMRVISAWQQRIGDLRRDMRFRHIIVFRNHRKAAGATARHPHSQVIALPVVPQLVEDELAGARSYFEGTGRCVYCDMLKDELAGGERVVLETEHFGVLCSYAARFAYGAKILPKAHAPDPLSMATEARADLALVLRHTLQAYRSALFNPPYSLMLQMAPVPGDAAEETALAGGFHWHISITPHLGVPAGFEWGTEFYINPVAPEEAAAQLRQNLPA
jgi:UDPglucose--hexose-1-phosphate uridylyltransferase